MRSLPAVLVLLTSLAVPAPAFASGFDNNKPADQQSIDALQARAAQAKPQEQCFLYAELVHEMIEFSAQQYASGEIGKAAALLKQAQAVTQKLQAAVAIKDKKLKDAQIILRQTAFRLNELLHSSDYEDRPLMAQTLAELNAAQNQTMMAVFQK
jgi:hypothetical protein